MGVIPKRSGKKSSMNISSDANDKLNKWALLRTRHGRAIPVAILGIGLALLTFGVVRGEAAVVFTKAIRICLECIGIG